MFNIDVTVESNIIDDDNGDPTSLYNRNITIETLWRLGAWVAWYHSNAKSLKDVLRPQPLYKPESYTTLSLKFSITYYIVSKEEYDIIFNNAFPDIDDKEYPDIIERIDAILERLNHEYESKLSEER